MRRRGVARQKPAIAALLAPEQRKKLAIKVLTKNQSITNLAREEQVSRKFLYQQKQKATDAIENAFTPSDKNKDVLFYLPITKTWLQQFILAAWCALNSEETSEAAHPLNSYLS